MSTEWFTASELAGMPGMPSTESGVIRRARIGGWMARQRAGRGGGREYHVSALPQATRAHLLRASTAQTAASMVPEVLPTYAETQQSIAEMSHSQREVLQARLYVLSLIDEISAVNNVKRLAAITTFLTMAASGQLPEAAIDALRRANARKGKARLADRATVYRWFEKRDKRGTAAAAPRAHQRHAMPDWMPRLLALYQQPQKPSVSYCVHNWHKHYPDQAAPNLRTAQRRIEALPVEVREYRRMGRNALRAVQPFVRRTTDGLWPMDVVTVDGHLFKAYVRHPYTGRKIRPEVTTYLDIATRKAVGFSAWLAESQYAIWCALSEMVMNPEVGVMALQYSDNGAYRGEQHRTTLARIGASLMFSQAYRAQARGVIERFNSSVWVPLAKTMPTYVNDDSDPEYIKRQLAVANDDGVNLMAWDDFVTTCRTALAEYNARPHKHLKGKSPDEAWSRAVADGWQPTQLHGDDLHDLLPSLERVVTRGEISLPWGRYFSDQLRAWHKQAVRVAFNPTRGESVWVATQQGRLICIAKRDGNAVSYVPASQLEHARAQREAGRVARLEKKLDDVREEGAAQIGYAPLNDDEQALLANLETELGAQPPRAEPQTPEDHYAKAYMLEHKIADGETVSLDDINWLQSYQGSIEYRVQKEFHNDFGLVPEWQQAQ